MWKSCTYLNATLHHLTMPSNSQAGTTSPPSQISEPMTSEEQHGTPNDASGASGDVSQYDNLVLKERMVERRCTVRFIYLSA